MDSGVTSEVSSTTVNPGSADNMGLSSVFLYIYLTLAIITISGNGIVIISYVIDKSIRLSTPNTYIFNLAIADFLVGVFEFLANFIWSISGANSNPSLIPCFLWGWFRHAGTLFSAVVVLLLSWDRYKLVSNALTYRRDQTPRKAALRSAIAWAAVCAYAFFLHLMGLLFYSAGAGCILSEAPKHVIIISFFPEFLLPMSIIVGLNVKVLLALRRRTLSKIRGNLAHEHDLRIHSCFNGNTEQTSSNILGEDESKISPKNVDKQETGGKNILDETYRAEGNEHINDDETSGIKDFEATTVNVQFELENRDMQLSDKEREQNRNVYNLNAPVSPKFTTEDKNVCKEGSGRKRIQKSQVSKKTKKEMHKLYKAVKALVIFTCIYISCWIPFYVISLVSLIKSDMADLVSFLGTLTLAFNSTINPFLYAAMSMKFRRRFLLLLKCQFSRN